MSSKLMFDVGGCSRDFVTTFFSVWPVSKKKDIAINTIIEAMTAMIIVILKSGTKDLYHIWPYDVSVLLSLVFLIKRRLPPCS